MSGNKDESQNEQAQGAQGDDTAIAEGNDERANAEDADLDAFSRGVAEAAEHEDEAPLDDEPAGDDEPAPEVSEDDALAPAAPDEPAAEDPGKAVEDEITERGLKGKAADRFRELANANKEYEPVVAALKQAGIQTADLPAIVQRARNHDEWTQMITDSTAQPDQLADAMSLIKAINSDDTQTLEAAYTKLEAELAAIGKRIGREAPGYDPMTEHADIAEMLDNGDITREAAQQIVQARALLAQQQAQQGQHKQQQQQAQLKQQAQNAAIAEIETLNATLKQQDPAGFAQRVAAIDYAAIKQYPPEQWPARIEAAYWRAQVAPAKPPVPSHVPLRPAGNRPMQRVPQSDMEAFEMGVAAAR